MPRPLDHLVLAFPQFASDAIHALATAGVLANSARVTERIFDALEEESIHMQAIVELPALHWFVGSGYDNRELR